MKKNTVKIRINGTAQEFTYNIRKDHRWHTRIQIGCKYNENGNPVYQYKHIYAQGELELKDKIREYFEDAEEKKNKKLIFELDILDWLYLYKFKKVRPTTYDRYEQVIKYQIIPAARATLSNKKVTEIKNDDCMRMLRWIADSECSVSTLKKAIMLLNSYFSNKVKNKTISDSPAGFKLRDIIFDADFSDQQVYFEDEDIIFLSDDEIKKVTGLNSRIEDFRIVTTPKLTVGAKLGEFAILTPQDKEIFEAENFDVKDNDFIQR